MFQAKWIAIVAVIFFPFVSQAFPLKANAHLTESIPVSMTDGFNFAGIVALSNCSGSLIRLEHSKDTDQGLVLTNGHCLESGMPDAGTFVSHQPSSRPFNLLDENAKPVARLHAVEVVYSSMTKTDMTIYKISETYADIQSQSHIAALTLSSRRPTEGTNIEVISGYWKRGYSCSVQKFVSKLKEAQWTFEDSIRYLQPGCETIGGTSGSPIVQAGTRTVIGVNNTGNEDGEQCTINNPCEVDERGNVIYEKGAAYGQQTYWVYSCLNAANEIDLSVTGCLLYH